MDGISANISGLAATLTLAVVWYLVIQLISLTLFPFLASLLPDSEDRGYGISKALGLWFYGYIVWLLASADFIDVTRSSCTTVLIGLIVTSGFMTYLKFGSLRALVVPVLKRIWQIEMLFAGGYIAFLVIAAYHPEIFWGEKPMDFTFLNYFIRLENLPPDDPWAAGERVNYYYLGTFFYALIHKIASIDSAWGYNFAIATIAASHLVAGFGLGLSISKKAWVGLVSAAFLVLASNLELAKLVIFGTADGRFPEGFDLYWKSTRVFSAYGFAEFPLWSILFADLHAHLINLPFSVGLITLGLALLRNRQIESFRLQCARAIFYGSLLGSMFAINSWDCVAYSLFTACLFAYRILEDLQQNSLRATLSAALRDGFCVVAAGVLTALPFIYFSFNQPIIKYGFASSSEFNSTRQLLTTLGHWIIPILMMCGTISIHRFRSNNYFEKRKLTFLISVLLAALPIFGALASLFHGEQGLPWGIISCSALLILLSSLSLMTERNSIEVGMVWIMIFCASLVLAGAELFILSDRMNTIFKFYHVIWTLLSIATATLIPLFFICIKNYKSALERGMTSIIAIIACLPLSLSFIDSAANIWIMCSTKKDKSFERPTLNGLWYLDKYMSKTAGATRFVREKVKGTPVLLEAHGPSYQSYSRFAMHTGLPTVLGWDYHVLQRGTPNAEIQRRKLEIAMIYGAPSVEIAYNLLQKYRVQLIVVSSLEERLYADYPGGLSKFKDRKDLFKPLYNNDNVAIYVPAYSPLWHQDF